MNNDGYNNLVMLEIVYTINAQLKESLSAIDETRKEILLFPLSRKQELRLRWQAAQTRIYGFLSFIGEKVTRPQVTRLLLSQKKKRLPTFVRIADQFRRAIDEISYNWYAVRRPISLNTIVMLHDFFSRGQVTSSGKEYSNVLEYLISGKDDPVIQSAVAYIEFVKISPFKEFNKETAELIPYLFLYKHGYDFRGLFSLSDYFFRTPRMYSYAYEAISREKKLTRWLEYYCAGVVEQLIQIKNTLNQLSFQTDMPSSFFDLTDRQKEILSVLSNPEEAITNRKVQKRFRVSQITASRDLSKLATLGLLFPHGKGRSVYYTRV